MLQALSDTIGNIILPGSKSDDDYAAPEGAKQVPVKGKVGTVGQCFIMYEGLDGEIRRKCPDECNRWWISRWSEGTLSSGWVTISKPDNWGTKPCPGALGPVGGSGASGASGSGAPAYGSSDWYHQYYSQLPQQPQPVSVSAGGVPTGGIVPVSVSVSTPPVTPAIPYVPHNAYLPGFGPTGGVKQSAPTVFAPPDNPPAGFSRCTKWKKKRLGTSVVLVRICFAAKGKDEYGRDTSRLEQTYDPKDGTVEQRFIGKGWPKRKDGMRGLGEPLSPMEEQMAQIREHLMRKQYANIPNWILYVGAGLGALHLLKKRKK